MIAVIAETTVLLNFSRLFEGLLDESNHAVSAIPASADWTGDRRRFIGRLVEWLLRSDDVRRSAASDSNHPLTRRANHPDKGIIRKSEEARDGSFVAGFFLSAGIDLRHAALLIRDFIDPGYVLDPRSCAYRGDLAALLSAVAGARGLNSADPGPPGRHGIDVPHEPNRD
ncbi:MULTISPECIES: hypothetical protein [unclassified Bradyrhizobium]|uniref:hypothetical protein n=1 Tax=unclassified Bradyrhizobium TaxID=2631580 RepID=UPI0024E14FDD|nr:MULTISPECIES: hypothetical protein [unclassified Bradyrhizobium]